MSDDPNHTDLVQSTNGAFPLDRCSARDIPLPGSSSTRYSSSHVSLIPPKTSTDVPALQHDVHNPRNDSQLARSPYISNIKALSRFLPHFRYSLQTPRYRHKYDFSIYDFEDNRLVGTATRSFKINGTLSGLDDLLIKDIPSSLNFRLVLVEDLSEDVIEQLGSTCKVSPEFFEEHLINSSWEGGYYEDQEPNTWKTHGLSKDYVSIRWHRPVVPLYIGLSSTEIRTSSTENRASSRRAKSLFSVHGPARTSRLEWTEEVYSRNEKVQVEHRVSPLTNIQRSEWKLSTNAKEIESKKPSLAEERASVWSSVHGHCRLVVCLFDPLSGVEDRMTGARAVLSRMSMQDNAQGDRTEAPAPRPFSPAAPPPSPLPPLPPSVRKHDVRISNSTTPRKKTFVQTILRPLRALSVGNISQRLSNEVEIELNTPHSPDESDQRNADGQLLPSTVPRNLWNLRGNISQIRQAMRQTRPTRNEIRAEEEIEVTAFTNLFKNLIPRSPQDIAYGLLFQPSHQSYLMDQIGDSTSTSADLGTWLRHAYDHEQRQSSLTPLDLLLDIITSDTIEALKLIDSALSEIDHDMLDDAKLEENLPHWRVMIDKIGTELRQTRYSLITFTDFLSQANLTTKAAAPVAASKSTDLPNDAKLPNVLLQIAALQKRTLTAYQLLTANVSIIESKRGIAEAESVSRLTELAFLFIPLTFSASIFSMQVRELSGDNISIYAFFILGFGLVCILYGIRLLIRSELFTRTRKLYLDQARTSASVPLGSPTPARVLFVWVWYRFWLISIVGTLLTAMVAVSVAELWTQETNVEFKILFSLLIVINLLVSIRIVAQTIYLSIKEQGKFQQEVLRSQEEEKMKIGWLVLLALLRDMPKQAFRPKLNRFTAIVDLIMVPTIAVWARPLATSIKIVVTLCMSFVLVTTLVIYGVAD